MRRKMDAFIQAVEDARRQLIRIEGQDVSVRELIRRAGYSDAERAGVAYHLNKKRTWKGGHRVPPEIVERLASVLPISHDELARAAQIAAGYSVEAPTGGELPLIYARFLNSDVSDDEKQAVTSRMLQIIAEETQRRAALLTET